MAHEHAPHECYCPTCGITEIVDVGVRCNSVACPGCGEPMRAVETGVYHPRRVSHRVTNGNGGAPWGKIIPLAGFGLLAILLITKSGKKMAGVK